MGGGGCVADVGEEEGGGGYGKGVVLMLVRKRVVVVGGCVDGVGEEKGGGGRGERVVLMMMLRKRVGGCVDIG